MNKLKIEMVHDVVCSWCPIGYSNIKMALRQLNIEADFHFLPFELNPDMGLEGETIGSYFKTRQGWDEPQLLTYRKSLLAVAGPAGVVIDFTKRTHYYNSRKAHQLMHWAEGHKLQQPLNDLLIDAYFRRGLDISNAAILLELVDELGGDKSQAEQVLMSNTLDPKFALKILRVQQLRVWSVPGFIINGGALIPGSNSVGYFRQALASFLEQDRKNINIET